MQGLDIFLTAYHSQRLMGWTLEKATSRIAAVMK
jgi:hypothetical protein